MKLLVDANLSPVVSEQLRGAGIDASHVYDHDPGTASDDAIAALADEVGAAVVSADSDFATNLALSGKLAPSLVLFRSANRLIPTQQAALLIANLPTMEPELVAGAVVSLSPHASAGSPASAQVVGQGGRRGHAWVTISSAPLVLACH